MANEVLYSGAGDLTLSEVLAKEVELLLADRSTFISHPVLAASVADLRGATSAVVQVSQVGFYGYDSFADGSENTDPGNTALTDASVTVTVARKTKKYVESDLLSGVGYAGNVLSDPAALAMDAVITRDKKLTDMICQLRRWFLNHSWNNHSQSNLC